MCSHEPRRNILCHQPDFSREGKREGRQEKGKREFDAGDSAPLDTMDKKHAEILYTRSKELCPF